jgi:Ni/Fe-hydrogenase subunit HybB-like protein
MSAAEEPMIVGRPGDAALTDELLSPIWRRTPLFWYGLLGLAGLGTMLFVGAVVYTVYFGIGMWGNNIPVGWAFGITNFVIWIEIAHAGTFISSVLLLLEQGWRTSINRIAEAMTLFAVSIALVFPALHLGRAWFFYWLIPYPDTMAVWPQFKSSLTWDAAAVPTYAFVSFLFWYLGMIPDLATLRDRSPRRWQQILYGMLAMGWTGSARAISRYRMVYGAMAGLITALVIVVISVISSDFSIAQLPGWHSTIFPPYFIVAALYSGFGLATTLLVCVRGAYGFHNVITKRHLDALGKMLLAMGTATLYAYVCEWFVTGWYSGSEYERYTYWHGVFFGTGAWVWWMTLGGTLASQLLWVRRFRVSPFFMFYFSIVVNFAMWGDRFTFIVLSLQRGWLPSSWHAFHPSWVDWSLFAGAISTFAFLFLLFIRFLPFVPTSELKELRRDEQKREGG